jgi:excisionase family DNA binding protein
VGATQPRVLLQCVPPAGLPKTEPRVTLDLLLEQLADLVAERVAARLNGQAHPLGPAEPERLLTAREVAERLKCSPRYVYAHAGTFPFTKRNGGLVRFSAAGLERWLAKR